MTLPFSGIDNDLYRLKQDENYDRLVNQMKDIERVARLHSVLPGEKI